VASKKVTRIIDTRYAAVSFNSHDALLEKALPTPCSDNCLSVCFIHRWISLNLLFDPALPDIQFVACHDSVVFNGGISLGCGDQSAIRHSPRNTVGSELVAQAKVQATASGTWYPGATRQWLPRLPSRECNSLMNSFGASQKLRQQRLGHADGSPVTDTIYTHVISEDGKRVAAQLGNAVWGILDAIHPRIINRT